MTTEQYHHRVMTKDPESTKLRIEQHLKTTAYIRDHDGFGNTAVDWYGPKDPDLDFLRPDVLPPKEDS